MKTVMENVATVLLWCFWIYGGINVAHDYLASEKMEQLLMSRLQMVVMTPLLALALLSVLLFTTWIFRKKVTNKKSIPSKHEIGWSTHETNLAKQLKLINLSFSGGELRCKVFQREISA